MEASMAVTPSTLRATIAIGQACQDPAVRGRRDRSLLARCVAVDDVWRIVVAITALVLVVGTAMGIALVLPSGGGTPVAREHTAPPGAWARPLPIGMLQAVPRATPPVVTTPYPVRAPGPLPQGTPQTLQR